MLEVSARDVAAAQGALAVVAILTARGAGPYAYSFLFAATARRRPGCILAVAGGCFAAAAYAARASPAARDERYFKSELRTILGEFDSRRNGGSGDLGATLRSAQSKEE